MGIEIREIDRGQAWQNYADSDFAKATTWAELQAVHDRFFHDYNGTRRDDRRPLVGRALPVL